MPRTRPAASSASHMFNDRPGRHFRCNARVADAANKSAAMEKKLAMSGSFDRRPRRSSRNLHRNNDVDLRYAFVTLRASRPPAAVVGAGVGAGPWAFCLVQDGLTSSVRCISQPSASTLLRHELEEEAKLDVPLYRADPFCMSSSPSLLGHVV